MRCAPQRLYCIRVAQALPFFNLCLALQRLAQSLYYLLLKCCFNQQRYIWADALESENNILAPWRQSLSSRRSVRMAEAEQVRTG